MNIEESTTHETKIDKEKLKKIVFDFVKKKGYRIDDPKQCENQCGNWNQQVGMELAYNHQIPCKMLWVQKANDFLPTDHPAVEHGKVYHCFIEVKGADLYIDLTPRQFDSDSDEIVFLSKKEIEQQGWRKSEGK
jgi:hypothetical protein